MSNQLKTGSIFISCFSSKGAASKTVYCIRFLFRLGKQSVDELTGKLRRGSLRYIEAVELAKSENATEVSVEDGANG